VSERPAFEYFRKKGYRISLDQQSRRLRGELLSTPVEPIDLAKVTSVGQLVEAWMRTSIQARSIAMCARVYEKMLRDESRPVIFIGLSGALIAGGLRKVIRDLVEYGLVDVIVCTGAIAYQDFYNAVGYKHYMGTPDADDALLHDLFIDRIYDTYVDEIGFVHADDMIADIASRLEPRDYSTREFLSILGSTIKDPNSFLYAAWRHGVPVFCPAVADSSIGIGLAALYQRTVGEGGKMMWLDTIRDNYEIAQIVMQAEKTGAIYIGGGVPKNYINDAAVMLEYTKGHSYAFQLTTDPPHWGGLSGSTLDEAKSWGKLSKELTRATAYVDATIGLPLVAAYVFEKQLWRGRARLVFKWEGPRLASITRGETL
jgi:deoxyhypusine synthase